MPVQNTGPTVVARIERLAAATGVTKTTAAERAVDGMLASRPGASDDDFEARALATFARLDRAPDHAAVFEAIDWDERGLPR
jgi:antitoxin VapB